jgi:GNAT superfamily N-acetyltransferase
MSPTFSSPVAVCRPALPRDTADVKHFCKFIWDGHDYVPYVWPEWLADPRGQLVVAEYAGHTVGLAKMTLLAPGQWWLEGFRVDPQLQGLKIGSHINQYVNDWWLEHGDGVVRLMTSSERVQVHHLSERLGYMRIGAVERHSAPALAQPTNSFRPVKKNELSQAFAFAQGSPSLALSHGLMDLGWQFLAPDEPTLGGFVEQTHLWWWREEEGLLAAQDGDEDEDKTLYLCLLACQIEALSDLLHQVRLLATHLGYQHVSWIAPQDPVALGSLKQAGYELEWDHPGVLYERLHPVRG